MHSLYENISLTNLNSYIYFLFGGEAFVAYWVGFCRGGFCRVAYVWVAFVGGGGLLSVPHQKQLNYDKIINYIS